MAHGHVGYTLWRDEAEQVRGEKVLSKQSHMQYDVDASQVIKWRMFSFKGREKARDTAWFHKILLYVKLLALKRPPLWETGQRLADGPELMLPFLQLFAVFKICGGWQGESIPVPNHKGEQDQRHDPLRPAEKEQMEKSFMWGL